MGTKYLEATIENVNKKLVLCGDLGSTVLYRKR